MGQGELSPECGSSSRCAPVSEFSLPRLAECPRVLSVGAQHLKANDTLMAFFIKAFSAFVGETEKTRVFAAQGHFSTTLKWWHSKKTRTQSQSVCMGSSTAGISQDWYPGSSV